MNCDEVKDRLIFYLGGEVTTGERRLVKQHLAGCSACQQDLAALQATRAALRRALQSQAQNAEPPPQAWAQMQANLARDAHPSPSKQPAQPAGPAQARERAPYNIFKGVLTMRKRTFLAPALAVIVILSALTFYLAKNVTPVSAQQILDRAAAAQSTAAVTEGIEHNRIEVYSNIQALAGTDPGTRTIVESYMDIKTGTYRIVTTDARTGQVLSASGYDGTYTYTSPVQPDGATSGPTIYRYPQNSQNLKYLQRNNPPDPQSQNEAMFDQFRSSPNVNVIQETGTDGRRVYVLTIHQQIKIVKDGATEAPQGSVTMIFDAQTYQMLKNETSLSKDGQNVVVTSIQYLANEILPADTAVAWNFSDLQGVTIVDDPTGEHSDLLPETETQKALVAQGANPYVLNFSPDGFTQEITGAPNQPKDQPQAYIVAYRNAEGDYFVIQSSDVPAANLPQSTPGGETYQTTSGLRLDFGPPLQAPSSKAIISATVTAPDGTRFTITSTLPMDTVIAWAENLIPSVG
jgi:hypothetical protein